VLIKTRDLVQAIENWMKETDGLSCLNPVKFVGTQASEEKGGKQEKIFRNRPIRNKNCLWRLCLITDRDEMINLYKGPSIDASYQPQAILVSDWLISKNPLL
jgi:hypothetical protein